MLKRAFLLVLIAAVVILGVSVAVAQSDEMAERWFYYANVNDGITAYNLAGENRVLIESGAGRFRPLFELDGQRWLATIEMDGVSGLFILTPDGPVQLNAPMDINFFSGPVVARSGSHLVILESPTFGRRPAALIDLDAQAVEPLTGLIWYTGYDFTPTFSADGNLLRYFSAASMDETEWTLWERDLSTGDERALHTITYDSQGGPLLIPDEFGERWLLREIDRENDRFVHTLLFSDGSTEVISDTPRDEVHFLHLVENYVVDYDFLCEADCTLVIWSLDGGDPVNYPLPDRLLQQTLGVLRHDEVDGSIFVVAGDEYWHLDPDGTSQFLGYRNVIQTQAFPKPHLGIQGVDRQWVVTADSEDEATVMRIWDVDGPELLLEADIEDVPFSSVRYQETGMLIDINGRIPNFIHMALQYDDGSITTLPTIRGNYAQLLPDGTVTRFESPAETDVPGIYLYDPATEERSLLLELVRD